MVTQPLELRCTVCDAVVLTAPRHVPLLGDELVRRTSAHYDADHAGQRLVSEPAVHVARGRRVDLTAGAEQDAPAPGRTPRP